MEPLEGASGAVDALVLAGPDAWTTLRAWRDAGVRAPCLLLTDGPPPPDRPALEPVVLVRSGQDPDRALDRVTGEQPSGVLELPGGSLDLDRAVFTRADGRAVKLSGQEWLLLSYLAARPDRVIERDELQLQVWDHRRPVPSRAVDMAISRLRRKIEADPGEPTCVVTVRNAGYRLVVPRGEAAPSGFVGRRTELGDIARGLLDGVVVVVGPPGVGKSRTAAIAGARCGQVVHVELAGVRRVERAATALSAALGLPVRPVEDAHTAICNALEATPPRSIVLWDHADDVPDLIPVLAAAGRARQIVTCRRPPGGDAIQVRLDALPPADARGLLAHLAGDEPGLDGLAEVLDGLPLAIELAAARVRLVGAAALARLVSTPSGVLAGLGPSLGGAIEASWKRLGPDDQLALARLSRFRGAFPLDDGLAVSGASPETWIALVDSQLVVRDQGRFRVLHAVADFARAALPAPDADARFLGSVVRCAREGLAALDGARSSEVFASLASRLTDLWSAWDLALGSGDPAAVGDLCALLVRVLGVRGGTESERLALVEAALPVVAGTREEPRVRLLRAEIWARPRIRDARDELEWVAAHGEGDVAARAELHAARLANWIDGTDAALERIGRVRLERAAPATRLRCRVQHLTYADIAGHVPPEQTTPELVSLAEELYALDAVADAVHAGLPAGDRLRVMQPERAAPFLERVLSWADAVEDPQGRIDVRITCSMVLANQGDEARAMALLDEAEALVRLFQPMRAFQIQEKRGSVHLAAGRTDAARAEWLEVLAWARRTGSVAAEQHVLLGLVSVEADAWRGPDAVRRATEALGPCTRGGARHLANQAHLCAALASFVAGDRAESARWLAQVDDRLLTRVSTHQRLALAGDLSGARELARTEGGRHGEVQRDVLQAVSAGDPAPLDAWLAGPESARLGLEQRMLVRIWRQQVVDGR